MAANHFLSSSLLWIACLGVVGSGCASPSGGGLGFRWPGRGDDEQHRQNAWKNLKQPVKTHLAHARWQESVGNLKEARESYQIVLEREPNSIDAVLGIARIDQQAGHEKQARQWYQKALQIEPKSAKVLDAVAQFHASEKSWSQAVKFHRAAIEAAPENPNYRFRMGVTLVKAGEVSMAVPLFKETVGEAAAHYNVGRILYEQGKLQEAEQQLLLALLKKPGMKHASKMLERIQGERQRQLLIARALSAGQQPKQRAAQPTPKQTQEDWQPKVTVTNIDKETVDPQTLLHGSKDRKRVVQTGHNVQPPNRPQRR